MCCISAFTAICMMRAACICICVRKRHCQTKHDLSAELLQYNCTACACASALCVRTSVAVVWPFAGTVYRSRRRIGNGDDCGCAHENLLNMITLSSTETIEYMDCNFLPFITYHHYYCCCCLFFHFNSRSISIMQTPRRTTDNIFPFFSFFGWMRLSPQRHTHTNTSTHEYAKENRAVTQSYNFLAHIFNGIGVSARRIHS